MMFIAHHGDESHIVHVLCYTCTYMSGRINLTLKRWQTQSFPFLVARKQRTESVTIFRTICYVDDVIDAKLIVDRLVEDEFDAVKIERHYLLGAYVQELR